LIRQPDFVTPEVFDFTKAALAKKKPEIDTSKSRLMKFTEGLCVQVMHIGSYDDEPATIAAMERYATENSYVIDISDTPDAWASSSASAERPARRHHEIYLSDPRKVAVDKLKPLSGIR
jgi:hypothetical protein